MRQRGVLDKLKSAARLRILHLQISGERLWLNWDGSFVPQSLDLAIIETDLCEHLERILPEQGSWSSNSGRRMLKFQSEERFGGRALRLGDNRRGARPGSGAPVLNDFI